MVNYGSHCIHGCTEHKCYIIQDGVESEDSVLFHAHPSYRSESGWHDWALFKWGISTQSDSDSDCSIDSCQEVAIPGQIILFLEVDEDAVLTEETDEKVPKLSSRICFLGSGIYALIESLLEPLDFDAEGNSIVSKVSKLSARQQQKLARGNKIGPTKNLYLVNVDTIVDTIAALPNLGGAPGEFLFVWPSSSWSDGMTDYINE